MALQLLLALFGLFFRAPGPLRRFLCFLRIIGHGLRVWLCLIRPDLRLFFRRGILSDGREADGLALEIRGVLRLFGLSLGADGLPLREADNLGLRRGLCALGNLLRRLFQIRRRLRLLFRRGFFLLAPAAKLVHNIL